MDFLERLDVPKDFLVMFDACPVSLQTKALETLWANPGATLEKLNAKLKGKLTLREAIEATKAMARLRRST